MQVKVNLNEFWVDCEFPNSARGHCAWWWDTKHGCQSVDSQQPSCGSLAVSFSCVRFSRSRNMPSNTERQWLCGRKPTASDRLVLVILNGFLIIWPEKPCSWMWQCVPYMFCDHTWTNIFLTALLQVLICLIPTRWEAPWTGSMLSSMMLLSSCAMRCVRETLCQLFLHLSKHL